MSGSITSFTGRYRPFSNMWWVTVYLEDDGLAYPSVEHAYQASKTLDSRQRQHIRETHSPYDARRIGRDPALTTERLGWKAMRVEVMAPLIYQKFSRHDLRELVDSTKGLELVEGNWWHDRFFGRCTCPKHKGEGENWLGRLIMAVRDGTEAY